MGKINPKKLEARIKGKDIILFVLKREEYSEWIIELARILSKEDGGICYVSANRPAKAIIRLFDSEHINLKKFQFVDCISDSSFGGIGAKKEANSNVILYVGSPRNLTELSITISGAVGSGAKNVFVDALSTFLIYEQSMVVVRFAHNLISKLRESGGKAYLVALRNDISGAMLDDLSMFVDGVVEV